MAELIVDIQVSLRLRTNIKTFFKISSSGKAIIAEIYDLKFERWGLVRKTDVEEIR